MDEVDDECRAKKLLLNEEKWAYVVDRFRENLHIVLCMSPAGDSLRIRCRNFPGLVSSTTIDWFFRWPSDALRSVAEVHLSRMDFREGLQEDFMEQVIEHFVTVHQKIPEYATEYEKKTRRKVYATPKSYLDFLACYTSSLEENRSQYLNTIEGYRTGLKTLDKSKASIQSMSEQIDIKREGVESRQKAVKKLALEMHERRK